MLPRNEVKQVNTVAIMSKGEYLYEIKKLSDTKILVKGISISIIPPAIRYITDWFESNTFL